MNIKQYAKYRGESTFLPHSFIPVLNNAKSKFLFLPFVHCFEMLLYQFFSISGIHSYHKMLFILPCHFLFQGSGYSHACQNIQIHFIHHMSS